MQSEVGILHAGALLRRSLHGLGVSRHGTAARTHAFIRWAPLLVIVLGLAAGYAAGLHRYLSLESLRHYQASLSGAVARDPVTAAAIYLLVYIVAVALSFPGASVLTIAGGALFGCTLGAAMAALAATIGATVIFLAARTSLGELLWRRAGPRVGALRRGFQASGFSYLLVLRLVPIFPFWLVNLAAAVFGVRLIPYVAATAIGILPGTLIFSCFGDGLGTTLDGGGPQLSWRLFAGLAALGMLVLLPGAARQWRRWRRATTPGADPVP